MAFLQILYLQEINAGYGRKGEGELAIFHFTVKIVGRSKGKSIIAASAYLNGDVMKNEETGKVSYYTSKKEVVYTSLMMCENAPPEWTNVPDENIKRFQKSIRYQRAEDKEAALEKFKIVFRKQRLWNEVLKVEKGANAQLGRSFEFSLPKEWSRMEQIEYATDFIQRNFVAKGMCADWSIHDKGDGNPHVHLLVTMRPFKKNHTWGNKEIKDWAFVRDEAGNIVIDETHPNWWQDKKTPERHGIRIPVLDADGNQKLDSRNRKQWKRGVTDATGWNNPKNCELWRSEWAKECNLHLKKEQQIDHRSYERQGKIEIPTIHEGAGARKIEEKYQSGQAVSASWKVEENRIIKKQNKILKKLQEVFGQVGILLKQWKERLNDIRRKQRSYSTDGEYDKPDRGTTGTYGRDVLGDGAEGRTTQFVSGAESKIAGIKQRVARAASNLAKYRETVGTIGEEGWRSSDIERGKSDAEDDIYYPDLQLSEGTNYNIGKFGHMRCEYLKEFRHGYYMEMLLEGKLNEYLHDIDEECHETLDRIVEKMKEKQGVTEQLKAENQMLWVGKMNNIIACAEAVVVREVVYV